MGLSLRRRKPLVKPDEEAFHKALDAVAGALMFDEATARKAFLSGNAAKMPGTSWSNQGTINNALIARVTQNLAVLFRQGPRGAGGRSRRARPVVGAPVPPWPPARPLLGLSRARRGLGTTQSVRTSSSPRVGTASRSPRSRRSSTRTTRPRSPSATSSTTSARSTTSSSRPRTCSRTPPRTSRRPRSSSPHRTSASPSGPGWPSTFRTCSATTPAPSTSGATRRMSRSPWRWSRGRRIIPLMDFFGRPPADEDDTNADPEGIWDGDIDPRLRADHRGHALGLAGTRSTTSSTSASTRCPRVPVRPRPHGSGADPGQHRHPLPVALPPVLHRRHDPCGLHGGPPRPLRPHPGRRSGRRPGTP